MYEVFKEEFECSLYIDTREEPGILVKRTARLFETAQAENNSIRIYEGEILVLNNENFNLLNLQSPEDGFLFYSHILKIKPNRFLGKRNAVWFVSKILKEFWTRGYPAIAICAYEAELPYRGGYKSRNVPVPK